MLSILKCPNLVQVDGHKIFLLHIQVPRKAMSRLDNRNTHLKFTGYGRLQSSRVYSSMKEMYLSDNTIK